MKNKKPDEYKVSWGSLQGSWEILVHIALAICVIYAIYSFFHQGETENNTAEKTNREPVEKQASEFCKLGDE